MKNVKSFALVISQIFVPTLRNNIQKISVLIIFSNKLHIEWLKKRSQEKTNN